MQTPRVVGSCLTLIWLTHFPHSCSHILLLCPMAWFPSKSSFCPWHSWLISATHSSLSVHAISLVYFPWPPKLCHCTQNHHILYHWIIVKGLISLNVTCFSREYKAPLERGLVCLVTFVYVMLRKVLAQQKQSICCVKVGIPLRGHRHHCKWARHLALSF